MLEEKGPAFSQVKSRPTDMRSSRRARRALAAPRPIRPAAWKDTPRAQRRGRWAAVDPTQKDHLLGCALFDNDTRDGDVPIRAHDIHQVLVRPHVCPGPDHAADRGAFDNGPVSDHRSAPGGQQVRGQVVRVGAAVDHVPLRLDQLQGARRPRQASTLARRARTPRRAASQPSRRGPGTRPHTERCRSPRDGGCCARGYAGVPRSSRRRGL